MNAVLWTGNGASSRSFTGWGFAPNFVWMKGRSGATDNALIDSVRGTGAKVLESNLTDAENSYGLSVTSFDSDGFTGATGSINFSYANNNSQTYVGWGWKAGSSNTTNTSGSITSTVSVNATAGFSIVTYTGTGASATVGHGLGITPSMIIFKNRSDGTTSWAVYHTSLGISQQLVLNTTAAAATISNKFSGTNSTVIGLNNGSDVNEVSNGIVAYCWAAVKGFSAFGSYTGNGSTDGPFVYLGFRPRYVLTKRTDTTGPWQVLDSARDTYNSEINALFPNTSGAEASFTQPNGVDFLSNGFKLRNTSTDDNASGGTYILRPLPKTHSAFLGLDNDTVLWKSNPQDSCNADTDIGFWGMETKRSGCSSADKHMAYRWRS